MNTQSGDDTQKPTALAKLYLEDGTVLTGISFGSHVSAEGEVRTCCGAAVVDSWSGGRALTSVCRLS